ncbi:MAG: molybdenum ABC transporter ATP-binding protein [Betaproteobacteria bacterium]
MTLSVAIEHAQGAFRLSARFECGTGVTALFGRSGGGKTTLINAVAGLLDPRSGRIAFDGETLFDSERGVSVPASKRRFGYVFQEGRLFPHLTVRQNLRYSRLFERHPPRDDFSHVVELLGIAAILERRPAQLSGGEKQRVAIGRALLAYPRLLLLDEPLASLDQQRREEILGYLERLRDEKRVPMLYVSHTVEEVLRLADHVVLMTDGKSVAAGSVADVMGHPELAPAAGTFEGGTVLDATVTAIDAQYSLTTLEFPGGVLTVAHAGARVGDSVRVRIRARDVSIAVEQPRAISIQNVLHGIIASIGDERAGIVDVAITIGVVTLRSRITKRALHQLKLAPDMAVYALIKAVSLDRGVSHRG